MYQVYSGLLFELLLAVTSFSRLSRFTESVGRRGTGQQAVGELNCMMGSMSPMQKRQNMSMQGHVWGWTGTSRRCSETTLCSFGLEHASKKKWRAC